MCIDDAHWLDEESFELIRELFYVEGLDSRALAQVFEIEPSSVRARLHRVRASVARSLGG
jgi:DNA-directed RNA polymerase specialized sigma24 family protein